MLTTILGEFARRTGQPTPSSALIDVLGRFGVEEKTSRQTVLRASKDGWLIPVRSGRQTLWELSPPFEQFLNGGEEKIYGFTAVQPVWDRRWLVVLARAAEDNRPGRHRLETRLSWAGFGNPAPGVWISTAPGYRIPRSVQRPAAAAGATGACLAPLPAHRPHIARGTAPPGVERDPCREALSPAARAVAASRDGGVAPHLRTLIR